MSVPSQTDRLAALIASAPAEPLTPTPTFLAAAADAGVEFEPGEVEALGRFLALLLHVNEAVNLTAIRDPAEAWMKHIFDSLTLLPLLSELAAEKGGGEPLRVIDVGSGGGLPGIPLAIVMPGARFTLLEATGKKAEFLRHAVERLGLGDVTVLQARAEQAGQDRGEKISLADGTSGRLGSHREAYDAVVSRAVGRLAVLAELTVPFACLGGRAFVIKGQRVEEELREAAGALELLLAVHEGTVETPTGRIVVLSKRSRTPRAYPRRDGEPARVPLGIGGVR